MKYDKPELKTVLFTAEDALLAETLSVTGSSDDESPTPSFESLSDAIDIILGN